MTTSTISRPQLAADPGVDFPAVMRNALGHFCTGVAVITGQLGGKPVGMTVQSLVSISLEPPLVLFSPQKTSKTWPQIRESGRFCANILPRSMRTTCRQFARPAEDRFTDVQWHAGVTESPVLDRALAHVECEIEAIHEAGDHYIVLGRVVSLGAVEEGEPLLFYRGGFGSFSLNPADSE
jgi:3-hydroxy-9,10-secoandrosta-1,3,5(10)-triene-9,17-dione monooxygenase reductase component